MSKLKMVLLCVSEGRIVQRGASLLVAIFGQRAAIDAVYKNIEDILDGEMPPTVVAFESGPEIVSTIGGSGEGMNCSLPPAWTSSSTVARTPRANAIWYGSASGRPVCFTICATATAWPPMAIIRTIATGCCRTRLSACVCTYATTARRKTSAPPSAMHAMRERCQTDSKMILAGVSLGGHEPYRGMGAAPPSLSSESEPVAFPTDLPWRGWSITLQFMEGLKAKYAGESDQVILTFINNRSDLTVTCATCQDLRYCKIGPDFPKRRAMK